MPVQVSGGRAKRGKVLTFNSRAALEVQQCAELSFRSDSEVVTELWCGVECNFCSGKTDHVIQPDAEGSGLTRNYVRRHPTSFSHLKRGQRRKNIQFRHDTDRLDRIAAEAHVDRVARTGEAAQRP